MRGWELLPVKVRLLAMAQSHKTDKGLEFS